MSDDEAPLVAGLTSEELKGLLPEDINDGSQSVSPVNLDLNACEELKGFLTKTMRDEKKALQVYYSTTELALPRHAAADPTWNWAALNNSIEKQTQEARVLLITLETTEAYAHSTPGRWEASLLTRAASAIEAKGPPRFRPLGFAAQQRAQHDPLEYRAVSQEMLALRKAVENRIQVLDLANAALNTRKGRPRGSVPYPLIMRLAGYWQWATGSWPKSGRKDVMQDGPTDVETRYVTTGSFLHYCRLALACLPEDKQHGRAILESVVRGVCRDGAPTKASYRDDLLRI